MKKSHLVVGLIPTLVLISSAMSACVDADERQLNPGGDNGSGAGGEAESGGNAGKQNGGSSASGSPADGGGVDSGGAGGTGGVADGGDPNMAGGAAGSSGAGGEGGEVDEGILSEWALWAVPNPSGFNLPNVYNYDADDADLTYDQVTGLTWQKNASTKPLAWSAARDECEKLELGDETDWRLPTRMELITILDYGKIDPSVDTTAFPGTKQDYYWSSTPIAGNPGYHFQVNFQRGFAFGESDAQKYYARCVRGKTKVPAEHYTVGTGYVLDNYTHLMWEYPRPDAESDFDGASSRCEGLEAASKTDWRLPSIAELQSLIDATKENPTVDAVFDDVSAEIGTMDWAGTPAADENYWVVQWQGGVLPTDYPAASHYSRCVRYNP